MDARGKTDRAAELRVDAERNRDAAAEHRRLATSYVDADWSPAPAFSDGRRPDAGLRKFPLGRMAPAPALADERYARPRATISSAGDATKVVGADCAFACVERALDG